MDPAPSFLNVEPWLRPGPPASSLVGVRSRRVVAFCIDASLIVIFFFLLFPVFLVFGLATFGLGWMILPALFPAVAILYNGVTVSSWRMATFGMRAADLEMRLANGAPPLFLNAFAHVVLFYLSWTVLTPFVLLVSFFTPDKRCLHDLLAGVIVTRRIR